MLLAVAIASDYFDGVVARRWGTASAGGQLFDHGTDCLFVTAGLTGAALAARVPLVLPVLVAVAFSQYVVDSYWLHRRKQLRMSTIGRWNGIGYFVPLVVLAGGAAGGSARHDAGVGRDHRPDRPRARRVDPRLHRRPRNGVLPGARAVGLYCGDIPDEGRATEAG